MEYKVVWYERNSITDAVELLESRVQKDIDRGFEPIGSVSLMVTSYGACTVAQAMVRQEVGK